MEKGLTLCGSQAPVQKYWKDILHRIIENQIDISFIVTHRFHLKQISEAYHLFDKKEQGVIKVIVKTDAGIERERSLGMSRGKTTEGVSQDVGIKGLTLEE